MLLQYAVHLPSSQLSKLKSSSSGHLTESSHLDRSSRCQTVPRRPGPNDGDGVGIATVALILAFQSALLQNCLLRTLGKAHLGETGWRLRHLKMILMRIVVRMRMMIACWCRRPMLST